jgi:hypothetical protein
MKSIQEQLFHLYKIDRIIHRLLMLFLAIEFKAAVWRIVIDLRAAVEVYSHFVEFFVH